MSAKNLITYIKDKTGITVRDTGNGSIGFSWRIDFENNITMSVIKGCREDHSIEDIYEISIMIRDTDNDYHSLYDTNGEIELYEKCTREDILVAVKYISELQFIENYSKLPINNSKVGSRPAFDIENIRAMVKDLRDLSKLGD